MDDHRQVLELISRCHIFRELDPEEQHALAEYAEVQLMHADQEIFREGDPAEMFHIVADGDVLIRRREDETRSRDVARFIAGESFGEMDVLRRSPRSADAVAAVPGKLIVIPGNSASFADILHDNPRVFAGILHKLIAFVAGRIRETNHLLGENSTLITEIRRQVYTDKLTGLYNTAFLKDSLATFPPPANPAQPTSAILFFKPDRFKEINDTWGHDVGDAAIQQLAGLFREIVSPVGSAIRYRGNELVALLPGFGPRRTTTLAGKLLEGVRRIDLSSLTGGTPVPLTASAAFAVSTPGLVGDALLQCAYRRIMQARGGPGNTVYEDDAAEEMDTL